MYDAGDVATSSTVYIYFTTNAAAGGTIAPSSAFEAADVTLYKDGSATQRSSTSGWTMTSPFDSTTGLHVLAIDLSDNTDAGFYAAGSQYTLVLNPDTETVDGQTVVSVIGKFSILKTTALRPATAGRTLVVDAAGLADANTVKIGPTGSGAAQTARDVGASVLLSSGTGTGQLKLASGYVAMTWADIAAPTTTVNLSGTTIATSQVVASVSGAVGSIATGGIAAVSFAAGAIDAAALAADAGTEIGTAVWATTTRQLTATQAFNNTGTWTGNIVGTLSTLTTYTGNTVQTGDAYARLGAPVGASISADIAAVKANLVSIIAAIGAFTGSGVNTILGFFKAALRSDASAPSDLGGTYDPATDANQAISDAVAAISAGTTQSEIRGFVTKSGSTYYVSFTLTLNGALQTAGLGTFVTTFYDEDGTNLGFTGTPSDSGVGIIYSSGTLATAPTDNRPIIVKVGVTKTAVPYSTVLAGANLT